MWERLKRLWKSVTAMFGGRRADPRAEAPAPPPEEPLPVAAEREPSPREQVQARARSKFLGRRWRLGRKPPAAKIEKSRPSKSTVQAQDVRREEPAAKPALRLDLPEDAPEKPTEPQETPAETPIPPAPKRGEPEQAKPPKTEPRDTKEPASPQARGVATGEPLETEPSPGKTEWPPPEAKVLPLGFRAGASEPESDEAVRAAGPGEIEGKTSAETDYDPQLEPTPLSDIPLKRKPPKGVKPIDPTARRETFLEELQRQEKQRQEFIAEHGEEKLPKPETFGEVPLDAGLKPSPLRPLDVWGEGKRQAEKPQSIASTGMEKEESRKSAETAGTDLEKLVKAADDQKQLIAGLQQTMLAMIASVESVGKAQLAAMHEMTQAIKDAAPKRSEEAGITGQVTEITPPPLSLAEEPFRPPPINLNDVLSQIPERLEGKAAEPQKVFDANVLPNPAAAQPGAGQGADLLGPLNQIASLLQEVVSGMSESRNDVESLKNSADQIASSIQDVGNYA